MFKNVFTKIFSSGKSSDTEKANPIETEKATDLKALQETKKNMGPPLQSTQQPKIYSLDEHKITQDRIDPQAHYVIHKLRSFGHKAYLVGGGVRDLLLNKTPKDFDVSTSARPEEVRSIFRNSLLIGRRFRLVHVRFGKKIIEVSTFRAGETENSDLIASDNEWGTEEEDVLRRDFTINGLLYDPETQEVIDYVGGYPDIDKKVLRTIGKPHLRFAQDPVRMIRLIKFCARFDLAIDDPTFAALLSCKTEIVKSSSARVLEELLRMLESGSARPFFHLLHQYGLLKPLLPELAHYLEIRPENSIFSLLSEVDSLILKNSLNSVDRALLISCLIFPVFEEYLQLQMQGKPRPPHLGHIAEMAYHVIDCIFDHFFLLPRKIRSIISFLITSQYRLIPLDGKPLKKVKAQSDPFFAMALQLLQIRSNVHAHLLPHYTFWSQQAYNSNNTSSEDLPDNERKGGRYYRRRRR